MICLLAFTSGAHLYSTEKCTHKTCIGCIRRYFNDSLKNVRYTRYDKIQCPYSGCPQHFMVNDQFLAKFFNDSKTIGTWWKSALIKSFIANKVL
jgi:hypothetical protein